MPTTPLVRPTLTKLAELGVRDGSSPRERFAPDQSSADAQYFVKWSERLSAVVYFLGYAQLLYSGGPGTTVTGLNRLTPLPHPDVPSTIFATSCPELTHHKWAGLRTTTADGARRNTFQKTRLSVGYEHVPYAVKEDAGAPANAISDVKNEYERFTYYSSITPQINTLSLPSGSFKYQTQDGSVPHNKVVPFGKAIQFPVTRYVLRWVQCPLDLYTLGTAVTAWQKKVFGWPAAGIKSLIGRVNQNDWLQWAKGTLLLENVVPIPRRYPTIGLSWDFDVHYVHNPVGWLNSYYLDMDTTSGSTASGWYFVASAPFGYYDASNVPDGVGLYNRGVVEGVFDVTG